MTSGLPVFEVIIRWEECRVIQIVTSDRKYWLVAILSRSLSSDGGHLQGIQRYSVLEVVFRLGSRHYRVTERPYFGAEGRAGGTLFGDIIYSPSMPASNKRTRKAHSFSRLTFIKTPERAGILHNGLKCSV